MILLSTYRAIKLAFQNFYRNIWLSLATVLILVLTIFLVSLLFGVKIVADKTIDSVKENVDVSIYFEPDAPDNEILAIKENLENKPEVRELNYISKSQALENFKEKNKDNPTILESLEAIGENPLGATITIKARKLEDYQTILKSLDDEKYKGIIQDKDEDYESNQSVIQKLTDVTNKVNRVGLILGIVFSFVAILVVFNTIRITIYTHREEIGIMKLVGASNSFVRAPFIFESILYGILASLICLLILYSLINTISPFLNKFFEGYSLDIVSYFNSQFWKVAALQMVFSVFLSMVSSAIAIGKYLKV